MKSIIKKVRKLLDKFKSFSLKKKILVSVVILVGFFIVSGVVSTFTKKPDYTIVKATKSDITEEVVETGKVLANGTVAVYSPTTGVVEDIYVVNGEDIEEGADIAKVNSSATVQEQQAAYANYLAAKNIFDAAQSDLPALQASMFDSWDDFRLLAKSGSYENSDGSPRYDQRSLPDFHIAEKEWLSAEAKYKDQQAVVAKGQAQVASTWLLYQATQNSVVKAPASGIVENLSVSKGGNVSINTPAAPSSPIITISSSGSVEVVVALSESDIAKVKANQKAAIEIPSLDKTYKGIVSRVDSIGTLEAGVIRYNAYLEILNPDEDIRSGMTADATITTKTLANVLSVPNSAVKPYQGGRAVRVVGKNNKIEYRNVKIGVRGKSKTQILSGISEGQEVITALSNEQLKRPGLF